MSHPRMMRNAAARAALLRGMNQMTALLRPTLGPMAGTVAIAGATGNSAPDILSNAATITRRTIQIDDPFEDMGAMIVRQLAWTVFNAVGDGAATAVILCHEMVRTAAPYVAAGGSPMMIKRGLERGLPVVIDGLRRQSRALRTADDLARTVAGTLPEPGLAAIVGEIIDTVGADGAVLIEDAQGTTTAYEYTEGLRWDSGYLSYALLPEEQSEARLPNPRILLTDRKLSAEELLPAVEACVAAGENSLLVIAAGLSDSAVALLVLNRDRGVLDAVMAVKAPGQGAQRDEILADLAAISGGRYLRTAAGDRPADLTFGDLGTARQAWVTKDAFGLIGGSGPRGAIRHRATEAWAHLRTLTQGDGARRTTERRIGNLTGATALIRVGAATPAARRELRSRIESALKTARATAREGGVPGGGAAFLACVPALEQLATGLDGDEAFGVAILATALAAPLRAIARNAGANPSIVVNEAVQRGPGYTFDATSHAWVDPWSAGIVDPLPVAIRAVEASVSAATMTLTTEVLVRRQRPEYTITP